jgi:YfiH family protein
MFEFDLPGARVVFTTRQGGVSDGPFDSRNLGLKTGDAPQSVATNLDRTREELELASLQLLDQVHGATLIDVSSDHAGERPIADGASTTEVDHGLLITGADCPCVVLATEEKLTALHCGWRPVAANIIEAAAREFDGRPFDAVVGPGICQQHFEVGPEVTMSMGEGAEDFFDGRLFDLRGHIERRLVQSGARRIHRVEHCTWCEPEFFFSHRRDAGNTGRQAGIAWRI